MIKDKNLLTFFDSSDLEAIEAFGEDFFLSEPYLAVVEGQLPFETVHAYAGTQLDEEGLPATGSACATAAAIKTAMDTIREGGEELAISSPFGDDDELATHLIADQGSTCLSEEDAIFYASALLGHGVSKASIHEAASLLEETDIFPKHIGKDVFFYFDKGMYEVESGLALSLKDRLESPSLLNAKEKKIFSVIEKEEAARGKLLSQEQTDACLMALTNRFSVITGGPGTGKSATQEILIAAWQKLSETGKVVAIAPTGQAAKRLGQLTGIKAKTIHSFLKLRPGETTVKEEDLAAGSLVIVDETSMLDERLAIALLRGLSPRCHLVFVGDVAQLPPIGAGCILKELIESGLVPVKRLTKIFRQKDNAIAFNAAKIQAGNPRMDIDKNFLFYEARSSKEIVRTLKEVYRKEEGAICLTPFRRLTATGVNELNKTLRTLRCKVEGLPKVTNADGIDIFEGDKVIFLRNKHGLVNGENGMCVKVDGSVAVCRFGETEISLSGEELNLIVPAYAQTVHKSQGSEYETVIYVCDPAHKRMASREIVYTAVTRAKTKMIVVGTPDTFSSSITDEAKGRTSALSHLMRLLMEGGIDDEEKILHRHGRSAKQVELRSPLLRLFV